MTTEKDIAVQAIDDARALLGALLASDWQELHVVSGETEIFIARSGGGINPMREASPPVGEEPSPQLPVTGPETPETVVTAPHVATLVDLAEVGAMVNVGQKVATLRVLDEVQDAVAPVAGRIVRHYVRPGALIEYGKRLLSIGNAA